MGRGGVVVLHVRSDRRPSVEGCAAGGWRYDGQCLGTARSRAMQGRRGQGRGTGACTDHGGGGLSLA